jgi:hypothetical protein
MLSLEKPGERPIVVAGIAEDGGSLRLGREGAELLPEFRHLGFRLD